MIKRHYFYAGHVEREGVKIGGSFDGIVSVRSFFANPKLAWTVAREGIKTSKVVDSYDQQVCITFFERL